MSPSEVEIVDVSDVSSFGLLPPCADPRFDHRSCDYWEDPVHGSKESRDSWLRVERPVRQAPAPPKPPNPFAPARDEQPFNPFQPGPPTTRIKADDDLPAARKVANPFAPPPPPQAPGGDAGGPRKLQLLSRGGTVFGSYAKVLVSDGVPAAYAQFGPLTAFPRAQRLRELYPQLPATPLPAVITCIATTTAARGRGLARRLIAEVCADLGDRGFAAVEAYPDLRLAPDEASSAYPPFWSACGFAEAVSDERFPVMRRELD